MRLCRVKVNSVQVLLMRRGKRFSAVLSLVKYCVCLNGKINGHCKGNK